DGLPLAIELAAVRVKLFSPQKLLQRLENRLGMLTGGARDLPTRQQTLRGTLDWSYDLLDEAEKILLRRLAVFKGGRTLEAIEAVCNADGDLADVADGLQSLLDKSLLSQVPFRVRQGQGVADEVRFVMLETIHEYATERLKISGEDERVRRAHASFFRAFAAQARGRLEGPQQVEWVERLEAEHNNLRAALAWLLEYQRVDEALRLACSLAYFWEWRGYLSEGRRWLEAMLTSEGGAQVGLAERAQGYAEASLLAYRQGDFAATEQYAETSLALSDAAGSQASRALALRMLGILSFINGQHASAIARHEASLALYREVGDRRGIEAGLVNLGLAYTFTGDYDRAEQLCEEAVAVALAGGDDRIAAQMRFFLGLAIFSRGEGERAAPVLMATLARLNEAGDRWWIAQTLDLLAAVAAEQGEAGRAARLLGAASAVREALGSTLIAFVAMQERSVAAATAQLGPTFATLWAEGQAMTMGQAVEYALSDR
ncbi:MAG: tetratricopeptide repeat protein, partial [Anaerolineae bacterium]|nr:tetratricopeptide repeat protein [Anaerolineae bacterium]